MKVLGISALYHDSAASLIIDGDIVACAQEERFTRKKNDSSIPVNAIKYCLKEGGIKASDLDSVFYYDNPFLTLDRYLHNLQMLKGENDIKDAIDFNFDSLFSKRLWIHKHLSPYLSGYFEKNKRLFTVNHHMSHAASAFYPSPFKSAAIITIDGVGEWDTTTIGQGCNEDIKLLKTIHYPSSLGLLYSALSFFCGFKVNSGEYKFMGLAPYGEPLYYDAIMDNLIDLKEDGSYKLNMDYFDYQNGRTMTNDKFNELFDGPKREFEAIITKREMDIAASAQKVIEKIIILIAKHAKSLTGEKNLVLAGGVALNCVANGKLRKEGIFENIWIQPAAGDSGGALGCALYGAFVHHKETRNINQRDSLKASYLGPSYSAKEIKDFLKENKYVYLEYSDRNEMNKKLAESLSEGKIIGFFNGRMEFGPRALGGRSIIADPRDVTMQSNLNLKVKFRESFRPFAPSVLFEKVKNYFDIDYESPYMLSVDKVKDSRLKNFDLNKHLKENNENLLAVVNIKRSDIPAVTHVDYSARIQTVNSIDNPNYYNLISEFEKKTGCGVIVNTSFNIRGEPIVCSPEDAYNCFMTTDIDILALENFVLKKEEQPIFNKKENIHYELD